MYRLIAIVCAKIIGVASTRDAAAADATQAANVEQRQVSKILRRRIHQGWIAVCFGALVLCPPSVRATTIYRTIDGTIGMHTIIPDSLVIYGTGELNICHDNCVIDLDFARGIVEFDISSVAGLVTDATLMLHRRFSNVVAPVYVDVYGYAGNGTLEEDDYSAGTSIGRFIYNNEENVTFDVTAFINAQISMTNQFAGFVLATDVENYVDPNQEREYPELIEFWGFNLIGEPQTSLELNSAAAVPLPPALPLFTAGLGALGLLGWRRKRKKHAATAPA